MANQTTTTNNKTNRGFVQRENAQVEGRAIGSLCLFVNQANQKTAGSTGEVVLELNTNGHFNQNNGVDYALGKDVYTGPDGNMFVACTAWGMTKDRMIKLNIRKGDLIRVYGLFEKETFTKQDGTPGVAIRCKNIRQFEIEYRPDENKLGNGNAPAASAPAPAPAPAPTPAAPASAPAPAPAAPQNVAPAPTPQAPVTAAATGDVVVPF